MAINPPDRIAALPADLQDHALVDWRTVALILSCKDIENARKIVVNAGVPIVEISERRRLPRWGALKQFIQAREKVIS
jgi:hypothetical protein